MKIFSFTTGEAGFLHKACLLFLLFTFCSLGNSQAQVVVTEGFETQCPYPPDAFFDGCFPDWISTHGSPDNISDFAGVSPFAGQKYMHGYVRYRGFYCTGSPIRGEGIALEYPFQQGVTYRISYAFRSSGTVLNRQWMLTNGLPNNSGGANGCPAGEIVPPIPPGHQVVHSPGNSADWVVHTQQFTPQSNFGQLWFRVWNTAKPGQAVTSENSGHYYLDGFSLEIVCDPNSGVSAFHFEDEDGNPQTEFCYGEDVYLNGTASQNESQYYIDLWRRPIGSTGAFSWVSALGWTTTPVGVVNLTEAFANIGYYPLPGYEYQVKLAISNPPCIGWTETLHTFRLICCEGMFNPDFGLSYGDGPGGGPATLVAHSFETYSSLNIPVTHQWTVLAGPNPDTGPYTIVNQLTTTGQGTVVLYSQAQPGVYYTVIHKIITACGEVCFGKQRYGNLLPEGGGGENRSSCEFCGPIDCSILDDHCFYDPEIEAIIHPFAPKSYLFTWTSAPPSSYYILRIVANDPACCTGTPLTLNYYINSSSTSFTLSASVFNEIRINCFSYSLGYWCGTSWSWTDPKCFIFSAVALQAPSSTESASFDGVTMYPNPASDIVNLRFEAPFTGQIQLADLTGRVLMTQHAEELLQMELPTAELPSGIYWVMVQQGADRKAYRLVKQ